MTNLGASSTASFSACRRYRYTLNRRWGPGGGRAAFIGLNPSTADETVDDPTIRRCVGFAKSWGFGSLVMVNLFAYRATDPRELAGVEDPVGPGNDEILRRLADTATLIVAAWGANPMAVKRATAVAAWLPAYSVLGLTADGHPRHPLYMPKTCVPLDPATMEGQ